MVTLNVRYRTKTPRIGIRLLSCAVRLDYLLPLNFLTPASSRLFSASLGGHCAAPLVFVSSQCMCSPSALHSWCIITRVSLTNASCSPGYSLYTPGFFLVVEVINVQLSARDLAFEEAAIARCDFRRCIPISRGARTTATSLLKRCFYFRIHYYSKRKTTGRLQRTMNAVRCNVIGPCTWRSGKLDSCRPRTRTAATLHCEKVETLSFTALQRCCAKSLIHCWSGPTNFRLLHSPDKVWRSGLNLSAFTKSSTRVNSVCLRAARALSW